MTDVLLLLNPTESCSNREVVIEWEIEDRESENTVADLVVSVRRHNRGFDSTHPAFICPPRRIVAYHITHGRSYYRTDRAQGETNDE